MLVYLNALANLTTQIGGKGILTATQFPDDLDTTSLGLTITHYEAETANAILDKMLEFVNSDGILVVRNNLLPSGLSLIFF